MARRIFIPSRMVVILLARLGRSSFAWSNLPKHTKAKWSLQRRGSCSSYRCVSATSAAATLADDDTSRRFPGGGVPTTSEGQTTVDKRQQAPPRRFIDYPFSYHQELILEIESLTNRGWGIGRVVLPVSASSGPLSASSDAAADHSDAIYVPSTEVDRKWVVMVVPGVIPGEIVKVRVFRNFNTYSEADVVEVLKHHEQRVEPRCPMFTDCGGCQYQHMDIELQRYWKTRHVQEALDQYHVTATALPCLGTSETYGYRSKLTPHYQAPTSKRGGQRGVEGQAHLAIQQIGFQRQTSRQIVNVEQCAIATDPINAAYAQVRDQLLSQDPLGGKGKNKGATLLLRQGNADDAEIVTRHLEALTTTVLGMNFTYLAGNFFQNNYYVLPLMVQHVVDAAAATLPMSEQRPTRLVDCYCGSGLFAISAASRFESAVGIEINERAVQEATENAAQNHLDNCRFVSATAERIFQYLEDDDEGTSTSQDRTVVILDPPRKGCSDSFLEQLLHFAPARVVYLSCDPVTQARDLAVLLQSEEVNYEIDFVQPFDLFPQTRHIECLVVLNRQRSRKDDNGQ